MSWHEWLRAARRRGVLGHEREDRMRQVEKQHPALTCAGHVEHVDDAEVERAIKHLANAIEPRGAQTSQLIALLFRLVAALEATAPAVSDIAARCLAFESKLERVAAAVERIAGPAAPEATRIEQTAGTVVPKNP